MAADPAPAPDAEIIAALNAVYGLTLTAQEACHVQEHIFKTRYRYKRLAGKFDKMTHATSCWRRKALDRIVRLGGEPESALGAITPSDDIAKAYRDALDRFRAIRDAASDGGDLAGRRKDVATSEVLEHIATAADCKAAKVEAALRQVADLGPQNYIMTVV